MAAAQLAQRGPPEPPGPPFCVPLPPMTKSAAVTTRRLVRLRRHAARLVFGGLVALAVVLAVAASYAWRAQQYDLNDAGRMPQRAIVRDRHGELIGRLPGENRLPIDYDRMGQKLVRAILAREDSRFLEHHGIDFRGLIRSTLRNLKDREWVQGGSTLTMQLAKNTWPRTSRRRFAELDRKILELFLALRLENAFDKQTLFQHYANRIYLGDGCHGVEAASRNYFGKPAAELNWTEAASIAGLIRAPSQLNPRENPAANARERQQVFDRLLDEGWIEPNQAAQGRARRLQVEPVQTSAKLINPWLLEQVRRDLEVLFDPKTRLDVAEVQTSFDLDLQRHAEEALARHLRRIEATDAFRAAHPDRPKLEGAIALVGSRRGEIRALVGGRNATDPGFHRAIQMRRPLASTFKPVVYAAAFAAGLDPKTLVSDAPLAAEERSALDWDPENADRANLGEVSARDGLILSRNTVTLRVGRQAGPAAIAHLSQALGFDPLPDSETAWLGTGEGSPLQLASAYTAFAADGQRRPAWSLEEVKDRYGRTLFAAGEGQQAVLSPAVAREIDSCLHESTQRGSARWLAGQNFSSRAAGKTGTSNDFHDAWFVGYSQDLCGCVWIGFDQPKTIVAQGFGSVLALPLWAEVMR